jgi:hypothetical protein
MKRDPVRLLDDPDCSPSLRADLEAESRARHALAFDAVACAARLHAAIEGGAKLSSVGQLATTTPTKAGLGAGWLGVKAAWIFVGGVGLAGVVGFGLFRHPDPSASAPVQSVHVAAASAGPVPVEPSQPTEPVLQEEPAPAPTNPELATVPAPREHRASTAISSRAAEPKTDDVAAETAALARLREVAKSDPATALALADQGQVQFRAGFFSQEREAIAIGALDQLGRREEAKRRAVAFLSRYADSPLAGKVRRIAGLAAD